jgi:hypothetical protein
MIEIRLAPGAQRLIITRRLDTIGSPITGCFATALDDALVVRGDKLQHDQEHVPSTMVSNIARRAR